MERMSCVSRFLGRIYFHTGFSTKARTSIVRGNDLHSKVYAYLTGIDGGLECPALVVGSSDNQMDLLCR